MKNNILLFLFVSSSICFAACSEEDNENRSPIVDVEEVPELSLKENTIILKVGNQETADITQGGGEYKAFTINEAVASVELTNNKLIISGHSNGKTDLIISDSNNQYRKLAVTVYTYDEIKLNVPNINISFNLGTVPQPVNLKVSQGNGSYSATSDNEDIVIVSVQEEKIKVSPTGKEGNANITVTDFMGFTVTIPFQANISINPFTQKDLNDIMNNATLRYSLSNGELIQNGRNTYFTYFNSFQNNKHTVGYEYIDSVYDDEQEDYVDKAIMLFNLSFEGDRSIGVKQNGLFSYLSQEYYDTFVDQPVNIEIIKNGNRKIWGIFYFVNQGSIFYGHFCQNASPL